MSSRRIEITLAIIGLLLTGFALLFGDNIYMQLTGHSLTESVRRFFSPESLPAQTPMVIVVTATLPQSVVQPTPTATPRQVAVIPTPPPPLIPSPTTESTGPFREHQTASIGTGVFAQVTSSDGLAPYEEGWLQTYHFRYQRIRPEENPDGCGVSVFDTNKVWFSSSANTVFTVNGEEIGKLVVATGKHGYVFDYAIHVGDNLCAVGFAPSGYQIVIGPDMY